MFEWTPDLTMGSKLLDNQHKKLFKRLDMFVAACESGETEQELLKLVSFLEKYVKVHFATEEWYMEHFRYPQRIEHKREHDGFIERFEKFTHDLSRNESRLPLAMLYHMQLVEWLRQHLMGTDQHFGSFLEAREAGEVPRIDQHYAQVDKDLGDNTDEEFEEQPEHVS